MTHQRGKRSKQRYVHRIETWDERKTDYDRAHDIILRYCFHDRVNRDKVFTTKTEVTIRTQMRGEFNNQVPVKIKFLLDNKEYGEVLNRFPLRAFTQFTYLLDRGAFQR